MIKFFRKIRQNLLIENKTGKYLKYAIGEIILVVIGILIALQINNWNENQKKKKQLDAIYTTIEQNLKTDLNTLKVPIEFYERLDSTLLSILTTTYPPSFLDSINKNNYLECIPCKSNINEFATFEKQDNGIELLKKYEDEASVEGTDLSQEIIQFYTTQDVLLFSFVDFISNEAISNLKYYEQFTWWPDYSLKNYNRDAIAHFLNDPTYKNKVASFKILVGRGYLINLKDYEKRATDIITKIEKRRQSK